MSDDGGRRRPKSGDKFDTTSKPVSPTTCSLQPGGLRRPQSLAGARSPTSRTRRRRRAAHRRALRQLGVDWKARRRRARGPRRRPSSSPWRAALAAAQAPFTPATPSQLTGNGEQHGHDVRLARVYGDDRVREPAAQEPRVRLRQAGAGRAERGASTSSCPRTSWPAPNRRRSRSTTDRRQAQPRSSAWCCVTIDEDPKPRFAYSLQLDDRAKGNGDGVLQAGEKVDLSRSKVATSARARPRRRWYAQEPRRRVGLPRARPREARRDASAGASKAVSFKFALHDGVAAAEAVAAPVHLGQRARRVTSESIKLPVIAPLQAQADGKTPRYRGRPIRTHHTLAPPPSAK